MTEHFGYFDAIQDSNGHYDREYNAQQWTEPFRALVNTGVMKGAYNQLEVTTNGANMISAVKSGVAFIEGRYYYNDALLELTHDTEIIGLNRIDRVVVRMDTSTEARYVKTFIKKGVPSTNPAAPTLTQTPQFYEISLAQILVVGGQIYIASNAATDERGKDIICPWAGSNILPSFDNNALTQHMADNVAHNRYGVATGTNALVVTLSPALTALTAGISLRFKNTTANTGAVTLNVNGLGAKPIVKNGGTTLSSGNLKAGGVYTVAYDGTSFILQGEGGSGNAIASDLLSGKTATTDAGDIVGTMPNRGAINQSLTSQGQSYTIPEGYHNGSGKVTATYVAGKRIATGNTVSSGSLLTVNGLAFTPSIVLVHLPSGASNQYFSVYAGALGLSVNHSSTNTAPSTLATATMSAGGFSISVPGTSNTAWDWIAIE